VAAFESVDPDDLEDSDAYSQVGEGFPDTAPMSAGGKFTFCPGDVGYDEEDFWEPHDWDPSQRSTWWGGNWDDFDDDGFDDWDSDANVGPDDAHVQAALRKPITDFGSWHGDWSRQVIPKPKARGKPKQCSNEPCANAAESKLKRECGTCRKYRERHGCARPFELVASQEWKKAGEEDAQGALTDRLIDSYADIWLARETRLTDGDPRRANWAAAEARKEIRDRIINSGFGGTHDLYSDIGGNHDREVMTSWVIEALGGPAQIDQESAKALWKAVERRYHRKKKQKMKESE
jgi:hypothetical protein